MFKAIFVIVLIVVTVNACSSDEKKKVMKSTKETGSFLLVMKDAFMEGWNEGVAENPTPQEIMDSLDKQIKDSFDADMAAIKKSRIESDINMKKQIEEFRKRK